MALQVIGAGFGRTGTLSLKMALEQLGYSPCYHMFEILKDASKVDDWAWAADGGEPDWDAIFRGYLATVDWPAATYWRELTAHFPDARVILSIRDADAWFDSTQRTIFNPATSNVFSDSVRAMGDATVRSLFDRRVNDRGHCIAIFNKHNRAVIDAFGDDRLLVFSPGDGWEPLCGFLDCEVPETPYPRANDKEQFEAILSALPPGVAKV